MTSNRPGSIWRVLTDDLKQARIDMVSPHGAPLTGHDRYGESSRSASNRCYGQNGLLVSLLWSKWIVGVSVMVIMDC